MQAGINSGASEFNKKVVLITGAGRGIGRSIARAFAAHGATVAANDIGPVNLDETIAGIIAGGGQIKGYVCDAAKRLPIETLIQEVLDDWGRIDILINNAGVEPRFPLLDMDEWDWQRTLDVNLSGPFYTTQLVGRQMREQGGGVIVNVADSLSRSQGLPGRAAYQASKMGLLGLTRAAARELAPYQIRVNAICPGQIDTGWSPVTGDYAEQPVRQGTPEEAAALVLFLCSRSAAHLTGQAINIDGGLVMI